jgi:hypothetical protein
MLDKNIPNGFGVNERQFRKQSHAIVWSRVAAK